MISELWTRGEPEANGFDSRMHFFRETIFACDDREEERLCLHRAMIE
jgi:hypothetical protein